MPRKRPESLSGEERKKLLDEFWIMVALLESRDEVKSFFKDLLSETETLMLSRRIQIAKMLLSDCQYNKIRENLGVSYSTIGSVHKWLQSGFGGYEKALPKLEKELDRRHKVYVKSIDAMTPYTFEWLKRKYPFQYMLFNLMDVKDLKPPKKLQKRKKN
ncbi:YerC/YecD family TrpR-related protein [Patescibacteria group bacterium]